MSVPKHWLLGGWYTRGLIVHQQKYRPSDSNKNVDIKFNAHDAFLKESSNVHLHPYHFLLVYLCICLAAANKGLNEVSAIVKVLQRTINSCTSKYSLLYDIFNTTIRNS